MIDKNVFDCLLGCKNILEVLIYLCGEGVVLFLRGCFAIELYIFYKIGLNFIPNMQEVLFCLGFVIEFIVWRKIYEIS